jgi:hypothetical protein
LSPLGDYREPQINSIFRVLLYFYRLQMTRALDGRCIDGYRQ